MTEYTHQLLERFAQQAAFTAGYSPLYAHLYTIFGQWLSGNDGDFAEWLPRVAAGRGTLEVSLLLPAGLHRAVLAGSPGAAELAGLYPTVGGHVPPGPTATLRRALRDAIHAERAALERFIATATVQTNETGRGLVWLLPLAYTKWPAVHLLELGASAGLNLVADRRSYRLEDPADPDRAVLELGRGTPPQFTVMSMSSPPAPQSPRTPRVLSRHGGDIAPFHLRTAEDELALASFVWGDAPERLARLREGIAALRSCSPSAAPVQLHSFELPDELPAFLDRCAPPDNIPVVIYNTTVAIYLDRRADALRDHIAPWATRRHAPVLWLQWETPPEGAGDPPRYGWMEWAADLWHQDHHFQARLAWVHPHGTTVEWLPQSIEFLTKSMQI